MKYIITNFEVVYYYLDASFLYSLSKFCLFEKCANNSVGGEVSDQNTIISFHIQSMSNLEIKISFPAQSVCQRQNQLNFLIQTLKSNQYIS